MAATSEEGVTGQQSTDDDGSSGFRSFWKKGHKNEQGQDATFVSQDPSSRDSGCNGRARECMAVD